MVETIILGAIGIDTLKTPFGKAENILGGSATYAAYASAFFSKTGVVSIRGTDLNDDDFKFMVDKGISLEGVQVKGKTLYWEAEYSFDMNDRETLKTELNSIESFDGNIPESYRDAKYLFLANVTPALQIKAIDSMKNPELILIDTMNFWIESAKDELIEAIKKSDILILNDGEARQLFDTPNLMKAAKQALKLGLKGVIIKKGEHGSLLITENEFFNCPGYPLENLVDPTGCGDSFGGAFLGYYAKTKDMRKAMVYGSVVASFNAEGMGMERIKTLTMEEIEKRYLEMVKLREF